MKKPFNKKYFGPYLIIALLGFSLYSHVPAFDLTYMDDAPLVIDAANKFRADPLSTLRAFTQGISAGIEPPYYYRPVLTASFMLNSSVAGNNLSSYYLVNIILHIITACLIFALLLKLRYKNAAAMLLSALYVVSPVMAQAAAWLPGRGDTILAIFSILSFIALVNFMETARPADYFFHIFFFLLALFSKENALCLIVIFLLYIHMLLKAGRLCTKEKFLIPGWIVASGLWYLMRSSALTGQPAMTVAGIYSALRSIALNSITIVQYLGRIFFPFNLSVWPTIQDSQWITGVIAVAVLAILLRRSKEARPGYVIFGALWFVVFLIPTLARPDAGPTSYFFDHRACLSMAGLAIVLAETDAVKNIDIKRKVHIALAVCIVTAYSVIALEYSYAFMGSASFWENARRTAPHFWREPSLAK